MRLFVSLVVGLIGTGPALSALPPQVYEDARNSAASVLVIAVESVAPPSSEYGLCEVTGTVETVERGTDYNTGQMLTLVVECMRTGATPPPGGTLWQDIEALKQSQRGRAYLDAAGNVVRSQYEILTDAAASPSDFELSCPGYRVAFDRGDSSVLMVSADGEVSEYFIEQTYDDAKGLTVVLDGNVAGFNMYVELRPMVRVRYVNWGSTFRNDPCTLAGRATKDGAQN